MTPQQIQHVRTTFATLVPDAPHVAALFYGRLFELDPALRPMFRGDLDAQGRKLMQAIGAVVGTLERFESVYPTLRDLGRRHALYGVRDHDYDTVAAAFLGTLDRGLGSAFTPEVRDAWTAAYGRVAAQMKAGAAAWKMSPLARHVDESPAGWHVDESRGASRAARFPATVRTLDSVALHRCARQERSRRVGDFIVRIAQAVAAALARRFAPIAPRPAGRHARPDVI